MDDEFASSVDDDEEDKVEESCQKFESPIIWQKRCLMLPTKLPPSTMEEKKEQSNSRSGDGREGVFFILIGFGKGNLKEKLKHRL